MGTDSLEETGSRFHVYSCTIGDICPAPAYARGDELDPLVEEFIFCHCHRPTEDVQGKLSRYESAVTAAEEELTSYRDEPSILTTLGPSSFTEGLSTRRRRLEKNLVSLAKARQAQRSPIDIAALAEMWPELSGKERRVVVGKSIDCVIVERGTAPVIERAWIYRPGKAPITRIHGKLVISSDPFSADGERLCEHRQWSAARLEKELRRFLAGRTEWPTYREFADSGQARLFAQVLGYGGPYYWGHSLGVRVPPRCVPWNPQRLRAALSPFLKKHAFWPGARGFAEAGMTTVYYAARRHGGIRFWAEEFGFSFGKSRGLKWPKERIAKELSEFTKSRDDFPNRAEFHEAGLRPLYDAICKCGGVAHWAAQLGLSPSTASQNRRSS